MNQEILYTPEEIANILKLSKYTIYEYIKRGDIQAYHIGRSIRISQSQLELYFINTNKTDNIYDAEIITEGSLKFALVKGVKICVSTGLEGNVRIHIRPEDIILSSGTFVSSARNMFKGTVSEIVCKDSTAIITLDIGIPITAAITKQSMMDMEIKKGNELYAIFKTMVVKVIK